MTDMPLKGSAVSSEKVLQALQRLSLGGAGLTAGAVGGAGLGAAGAYQLAKRKPQTTGEKIKGTAKDIGAKAKGGIGDLKKKVMHLLGK